MHFQQFVVSLKYLLILIKFLKDSTEAKDTTVEIIKQKLYYFNLEKVVFIGLQSYKDVWKRTYCGVLLLKTV